MDDVKQYKGIVVSHTHWDRAWYWPFERFRIRLVETIDQILDILYTDLDFRCFVLDGQTVVLEDYLEVKPERRIDIERLVSARRLQIGPWYVLPDEFLVSGEALIRNLILGQRLAKQFGNVMKEGYVPDPFGHIRQLPQILQGCGIRSFIFTRGMGKEVEELGTEFWWEGPDSSKVLAINQCDGYGNLAAWGFPFQFGDIRLTEPNTEMAIERIKKTFDRLRKYSRTRYLLFNNGIDHLPPQPQVPQLIQQVNERMGDLRLSHGALSDFVDAVFGANQPLGTYKGELTGNYHHPILSSVYSSRMHLKQANFACQNLLERYVEPLTAWTNLETKVDYTPHVWQSWKELMRNHPHDDICGCAVDDVHRDDMNRFEHVRQICEHVKEHTFLDLATRINTSSRPGKPIVVYNPLNWECGGVVHLEILFDPDDPAVKRFALVDGSGNPIPFVTVGRNSLHRMEVLREARYTGVDVDALIPEIPACGYTTFYALKGRGSKVRTNVKANSRSIENEHLKVLVRSNGSLTITDKQSGAVYQGLNTFEDTEDAGDEYTYSWSDRSHTITTKDSHPRIRLIKSSALGASIEIQYALRLPVSLNTTRKGRSARRVECPLKTRVSLFARSRRVDVQTEFTNAAHDHRLRVLFQTTIDCAYASASGHFDVIDREHASSLRPKRLRRFEYYSTRHQNGFVSVHDSEKGLTIGSKGLAEYESMSSRHGTTIALTLLRSVGWLSRGDLITRPTQAGPQLETPEAQCPGKYLFEYSIIPHRGDWLTSGSFRQALEFASPPAHWNVRKSTGELPDKLSFVSLEPDQLVMSSLKRSEDRSGIILRLYNISDETVTGTIRTYRPLLRADLVSMNEEFIDSVHLENETSFYTTVGPKKIITLKLTYR